ncbi:ClpP/crotonase-like domain-containing protein [Xylaria intraflava]|nr:ClpP/crotonase-like domain-containing protein [Xylaria intraflava]
MANMACLALFCLLVPLAGVLGATACTPNATTSAITLSKVSPAYWRATFSNPPFNAQGTAFYEDLYSLIDQLANDTEVKVVVFDSNVEKFWISQEDLLNPTPSDLVNETYWGNMTRLANLPVVTVAAIRGIARGSGAEFAAALDIRFASKEKGIIGHPEVGLGSLPGGGGLHLLPILTNRGRAMEIVLGADDFDADTAALYGWINRAVPDAQFDDFVDGFARRVAAWDRYALAAAKKIINQDTRFPTAEQVASDYTAYSAAVSRKVVIERTCAIIAAGLQTNETFEINAANELLLFSGPGPWPVS